MLEIRVMPCLLLSDGALVKTIQFKDVSYIGDPINAVRIFNELEVDEIVILDIRATRAGRPPDFALLERIASECFMPMTYGGGIRSIDDIRRLHKLGAEKISINSFAIENPRFIHEAASVFGSQSLVVSIDVKRSLLGRYTVMSHGGTRTTGFDPVLWAQEAEKRGAGELLITSIDRDGTWSGYDVELLKLVTASVGIPVIASGGAGSLEHLRLAVAGGGASALAIGSMAVYQKRGFGVLINFPPREHIRQILGPVTPATA